MTQITKAELAKKYRVTVRTITNWCAARKISYLKIGRLVRFDPEQVDKELRSAGEVQAR